MGALIQGAYSTSPHRTSLRFLSAGSLSTDPRTTQIYTAVIYGTLYLCFAAYPIVFQEGHGWNAGVGGLAFIGMLVGIFVGVAIIIYDNRRYIRIHRETGGFAPPETRLPTVILGGVIAIVGLAWFAATTSPSVHWIVPILAGVPFGAGFLLIFMSCMNYL